MDRILRDGDTVALGDVMLTAYNTPGPTRGSTHLVDVGKVYTVVFPDGVGFNPGCHVVKNQFLLGKKHIRSACE